MKNIPQIFRAALLVSITAFFGAFAVSCVNTTYEDEYEKTSLVKVGDRIPDFTVRDADGKSFSSDDLAGKRCVIAFFVAGCKDCRREMPVMQAVWEKIRYDEDYIMVAINRGESKETVEEFFTEFGLTMPYYLDQLKETYLSFAEMYVPRIYIVDGDGMIEWMAVEKLPAEADTADEFYELLKK